MQKSLSIILSALLLSASVTNAIAGINLSNDKDRLLIKNNLFSIAINLHDKKKPKPLPVAPAAVVAQPQNPWHWIDANPAQPIPRFAVVGGIEHGSPLYICHANYNKGVHPGKIVAGNCNISWGGKEISVPQYQILVSKASVVWVPFRPGNFPPNAVKGGHENGQPLFICQANFNGVHPGKLVGNNCDIGYGGQEIRLPNYRLLVLNG